MPLSQTRTTGDNVRWTEKQRTMPRASKNKFTLLYTLWRMGHCGHCKHLSWSTRRRLELFWNDHMTHTLFLWFLIKSQADSLMWLILLIALKYYSLHAVSLTRTLICINFSDRSACFILIECAFFSEYHIFLANEHDGGQAYKIPFPYGSLYQVESLQTMITRHDKSFPSFILARGIHWNFQTSWKRSHLEGGKRDKLYYNL